MTYKQINTLVSNKRLMVKSGAESPEVTRLRQALREAKAKETLDNIERGIKLVRDGKGIDILRKACASFVSRTQVKKPAVNQAK